MKNCARCSTSKPTSEFHVRRASPDGLAPLCKACNLVTKRDQRSKLRARSDAEIDAAAAATGPKVCAGCKKRKSPDEFTRDRGRRSGIGALCRPCNLSKTNTLRSGDPELWKSRRKADHGNNRERNRAQQMKSKYGLTSEQYDALHTEQDGVCAICGQPEQKLRAGRPVGLAVDHDHETGEVRGLLCHRCNVALGQFHDSPELLLSAITYLAQHGRVAAS